MSNIPLFTHLRLWVALVIWSNLAVSSSPRPWIDVLALSEKFNMAVAESDCATFELSMWAWN